MIFEWKNSIEKIILFSKRRNWDFFRSTFWSTPRPKFKSPSSHPRHLASKSAFYPTPTFPVDQKYFDVSTPDGAGRRSRRAADLRSSPPKKTILWSLRLFLKRRLSRRRRCVVADAEKNFPVVESCGGEIFFPGGYRTEIWSAKTRPIFFPDFLGSFYFFILPPLWWFHFYSELTQAS